MSKLHIEPWDRIDAAQCFESIAGQPYALFFDSNDAKHPLSRWSFICWAPIETIEIKNNIITHNGKQIEEKNFFQFLQSRLGAYDFKNDSNIPFIGGAAGYFGYDLGRQLEDIPTLATDDMDVPDACIGIYKNVLAFDHITGEVWKIGDCNFPEIKKIHEFVATPIKWDSQKSEKNYCSDIQKIIDYIYAGEIYQANLTRRFEADLPEDFNRFIHYKYLRRINPAPFAGFMNFGSVTLASCSPERFLSMRDNIVETRPIKGTLPSSHPAAELQNSLKDRAENIMIVDLLRNDLSRVCDFHTVTVPELCTIETFEGLHHMVSAVCGVLQKDKNAIDVLRACFPGGSITGAPKIRAMEIIEEIEPTRRGPYCGAMGYIGFDGAMDTNIIIRTLIYTQDKMYLQTGGGIVSDSDPQKELQETLDKAAKIFESFDVNIKENAA